MNAKRIDRQVAKIREEVAMLREVSDSVEWEAPTPHFQLITNAIPSNRKARYCECGTKLSIYNLESKCYTHLKAVAY